MNDVENFKFILRLFLSYTISTREYPEGDDVRSDNQKNSRSAKLLNDLTFVYATYKAPFRVYAVIYAE